MRRLFTFLLVSAFFTVPLPARNTKLHGTPPEKLIEKARQQGSISILVALALPEDWAPEGKLDKEKRAKQREHIAKAQDKALRKHKLDKAKATLFPSIAHMQVFADAALIAKLAGDDDVVRIDEEQELTIALHETTLQVNADDAWNWTGSGSGYTGAGWIVAQLDTGVQKSHSAFTNKISSADEACFSRHATNARSTCGSTTPGLDSLVGVDGAAAPCDMNRSPDCYHGTVTAGVAVSGHSTYAGVAKGAALMPVQVMAYTATNGEPLRSFEADHVRALQWIESRVDAGRPVAAVNISLSVGGDFASLDACNTWSTQKQDSPMPTYAAAVASLRSKGVAVVAGSGNNGRTDAIAFPACLADIISVGAVGKDDAVATYSNRKAELLDMWAPGGTDAGRVTTPTLNGAYASITGTKAHYGTSIATPHVAGAFAILRQAFPNASIADLENAIVTTGPEITIDTITKHRLDLSEALEDLGGDTANPSTPTNFDAKATTSESSITITWSPSTDNVAVDHYIVQRRSTSNGDWEQVGGEIEGTSTTDSGRTVGAVYRYRVRAVDTSDNESAWSTEDMGLAMLFTDEPLHLQGFPVPLLKGKHVAELRKAIDAWRVYAGLSRQWSQPYPDVTGAFLASNLQELYGTSGGQPRGIDAARAALGLPAFSYSSPNGAPSAGALLYASHIQELRAILQ